MTKGLKQRYMTTPEDSVKISKHGIGCLQVVILAC